MRIIADLQLHSKYSRAVSPQMILPEIAKWAMIKRIDLMATGDWTHPLWFREIASLLTEKSPGLYGLKTARELTEGISTTVNQPQFLLSGEISSIYSQGGKLRRIHNLIFSPSIATVEKINKELVKRGANLMSDGRPIVGLTSMEIAEVVFSIDEKCLLIPAHAWTPWFSLYGSKSGFDSIKECFGNFSKYIYAIETGLSSDPAMNWRIEDLDNRSIISCSDAHSGPKLGREATVFEIQGNQDKDTKFTYQDIADAIKQNPEGRAKIAFTIEFYPEEGKYHYTGHRECQVRQEPSETLKLGTICPVCGKPLTVGVMHRVDQLAKRSIADLELTREGMYIRSKAYPKRPSYVMIVPLLEIVSESLSSPVSSPKVMSEYLRLCQILGGEFTILLKSTEAELQKIAGAKIAEGIGRVRSGNIVIEPELTGVFGVVKIWGEKEKGQESIINNNEKQLGLFS
ncbi:MAG: endonuclease Q family protein [Patescibacteria group bacterium]|nr:endonuclease Q family protein [Patescibacteria group bacterium]